MESPALSSSRSQVLLDVSTTFSPAAKLPGTDRLPDALIYSKDSVFFYCHQKILSSRSVNRFGQMIPSGADLDEPHEIYRETTGGSRAVVAISVGETASVMNLILLIAYGMSCANFTPDLDVIGEALRWLDKYGIQIPDSHSPTGIWPLVIQYAQRQPIRAYALAASHSMEDICVEISPLTLSTSLHNISESDALTMGPIFLRRLFFLHLGRRSACKQVFEKPPAQHAETASCTLANQIEVTRVWELKMADVVLHPSQENFPVEELRRMFSGIVEGRACSACIEAIRARVEKACAEWLAVKQTI